MNRLAGAAGGSWNALRAGLASVLIFGVLTLWVRGRWALSLLQAGVFILGIAWTWGWARRRQSARTSFLLLPLSLATAWGGLQIALGVTEYRFVTEEALLYWLTALVAAFLAVQALARHREREDLLELLLYFGFGVSVLAITQYFTSRGKIYWIFPSGYPDAMGPFVYRNNYAAFVELLLPLALLKAIQGGRRQFAHAAMAGVMYASVIACASRAGAVLATAEIAAVLSLALWRGLLSLRRSALTALKVGALAAVFVAVVGWHALLERFQQADPYVHRREMLQSSLEMARERPWMGFGLGTFETVYPAYARFDLGLIVNHAHNDWAEWAAEGGFPFLLITASLALWAVRPALRSVWGIGLLSVFLHALVDYPMQRLGLALWVFVLLGALAAEHREHREAAGAAGAPPIAG